ncbi:hypothetical protein [Roseomonas sp. HF4]|uniref:hypothetical protein n=1 Tax=Roseomonas sp. HF4 TaxID=2562313 RepID=UPI0010BFAAA0|nr:hypothetical protein [Roseomonas sp. HF4]
MPEIRTSRAKTSVRRGATVSGALMVIAMDTGDALLKAIRRTLASAANAETLANASRKTGQVFVETI